MKLREGNIFGHVYLSVHDGVPMWPLPKMPLVPSPYRNLTIRGFHWPQSPALTILGLLPTRPSHYQTYSDLFNLDFTIRDPWHVQICSIWSLGCRQAGGWHSIEMPYCRNMFCLYGLCHRNQTQGLPQINHCFRHECKHHSNRNCFRFNCKHDNV